MKTTEAQKIATSFLKSDENLIKKYTKEELIEACSALTSQNRKELSYALMQDHIKGLEKPKIEAKKIIEHSEISIVMMYLCLISLVTLIVFIFIGFGSVKELSPACITIAIFGLGIGVSGFRNINKYLEKCNPNDKRPHF